MNYAQAAPGDTKLREALEDLWERTGDENLGRLAEGLVPEGHRVPASDQERLDLTSSCLMNAYKNSGDSQVFSLLFELNNGPFMQAIQSRARRSSGRVDPHDVLQEVFLNIYRYPRRFLCERADSFRNWGHRIVRNTMLKFLKGESRLSRFTPLDEDVGERADKRVRTPYRSVQESESARLVDFAFLVYLNLYLIHFRQLSAKEQRALRMVEVEGCSYKQTADALGIRLENLKMVIFRSRRKIFRGMNRTLLELEAAASQPDRSSPSPSPRTTTHSTAPLVS